MIETTHVTARCAAETISQNSAMATPPFWSPDWQLPSSLRLQHCRALADNLFLTSLLSVSLIRAVTGRLRVTRVLLAFRVAGEAEQATPWLAPWAERRRSWESHHDLE